MAKAPHDVRQKGIQPDFNFCGMFHTDKNGRCWFKSVRQKHCAIPTDGPVGKPHRHIAFDLALAPKG